MTNEELNFIKDAFSQIIDDIAGNPDWGDAAMAVASNLGTLERELEEKDVELPFNLDELELTEFEQEVRECVTKNLTTHIKDGNGREISSTVFIDDDTAKKMATELLDLARKELVEEQYTSVPRKTDLYKLGREEALKDLPRWKKADKDIHLIRRCLVNLDGKIQTSNFIPKDLYYIPIIEIEHLLKAD